MSSIFIFTLCKKLKMKSKTYRSNRINAISTMLFAEYFSLWRMFRGNSFAIFSIAKWHTRLFDFTSAIVRILWNNGTNILLHKAVNPKGHSLILPFKLGVYDFLIFATIQIRYISYDNYSVSQHKWLPGS